MDLVLRLLPRLRRGRRRRAVGQGHRAVEGHPAHELGVHEVAGLAPDLPDPLVLLLPAPGGGVGQLNEESSCRRREPVGASRCRGRPTGPTPGRHRRRRDRRGGRRRRATRRRRRAGVDLQAPLPTRTGSRVSPARQMGELALGEIPFAADAEHDLQVAAAVERAGRRSRHVVEELIGLVGAGRDPEGFDREGGIANPGVAVVPVSGAAHHFGKRRGGRRADRAGGLRRRGPGAPVRCGAPGRATGPHTPGGGPTTTPRPTRCHRAGRRSRIGSRPWPARVGPARMVSRAKPALSPPRSWSRPVADDWSTVKAHWRGEDENVGAPATRTNPPSTASSSGWTSPYSGRGTYSSDNSTSPSVHVARRSRRCGAPLPSCVAAVAFAYRQRVELTSDVPVGVRKVVSNTMVRSR